MPGLDLTDVLTDPDFVTTGLICARQTQVVGNDGEATNTPANTEFSGIVTNMEGRRLNRFDAGERIESTIWIRTIFALSDGDATHAADIVTWSKRQWTVVEIRDYTAYGQGFVAARCDLLPVTG